MARSTASRDFRNSGAVFPRFSEVFVRATMEYAKTKDILHVMKMLGHKNIQNTLLYTQLINFESDKFHSATAKTVQDAQKLVEAGFEYVCEFNDVKIFKKRK
jgi:hypothetical protein